MMPLRLDENVQGGAVSQFAAHGCLTALAACCSLVAVILYNPFCSQALQLPSCFKLCNALFKNQKAVRF